MPAPAIAIESISKVYRIGAKEEVPDTLTGAVAGAIRYPWRNLVRLRQLTSFRDDDRGDDVLWALKNVSFDVKEGEVVGIIGRNGAGKSTLLKILSRITEPTSGRAMIRGRVSSLLEVGTGFHPELTGRENIYMNGTILGMTKREIDRKFDEIVEFSGVEKFLDTPTKRYSSGMQVRLAFAVAANLEPEILIIDEVLAVGDAEFQKRCLGKMQDVARSGRTVLFVSHNMASVLNLCSRALVMHNGSLSFDGRPDEAIESHTAVSTGNRASITSMSDCREAWCRPSIQSARIIDSGGRYHQVPLGGGIEVEMEFSNPEVPLRSPVMGLVFSHITKGVVAGVNTRMTGFSANAKPRASGKFSCRIPKLPFLQGAYEVDVWLGDGATNIDVLKGYLSFEIAGTDYYGSGKLPIPHMGTVMLDATWRLEPDVTCALFED
ncbi:Teichoic acids export ATP-binding protein TagH [Posidoniimonas corsicana]|uniref:Teichoic acids export ATP-binding protein TagH n=1 Tax=Posidoniimonas corsicana TaxID=1938618 RepID=A0A5C5V7Q7_9BACT|nr:ABC transporter ATP-binding protein [Posidoniimonas corsicana]TWT33782.1 Teichoic acids export ATP-binding protein TagH [Posidoniimonas corsicana]